MKADGVYLWHVHSSQGRNQISAGKCPKFLVNGGDYEDIDMKTVK